MVEAMVTSSASLSPLRPMSRILPQSIDDTVSLLAQGDYVAGRSLATAVFLALRMGRPLFLEGEAGVGKTEIAKVLAQALGRRAAHSSTRPTARPKAPPGQKKAGGFWR